MFLVNIHRPSFNASICNARGTRNVLAYSLQTIIPQVSSSHFVFASLATKASDKDFSIPKTSESCKNTNNNHHTTCSTFLISSPHPQSNIRMIQYTHIQDNEHVWEREYRKLDLETQEWVHSFFSENNIDFQESKMKYITEFLESHRKEPNSDDLSVFYAHYLEKTHQKHTEFNRLWLRRNFSMIIPGLKVDILDLHRNSSQWMKSTLMAFVLKQNQPLSSSTGFFQLNDRRISSISSVPKYTWKHRFNYWLRSLSSGYTAQGVTVR